MKNLLKKTVAVMLSLVMVFGCIPNFVNEAKAEPTKYSYVGIELTKGGIGAKPYDYGFTVYLGNDPSNLTFTKTFVGSDFAWFANNELIDADRGKNYRTKKDTTYQLKMVYPCRTYDFDVNDNISFVPSKSSENVMSAGYFVFNNDNLLEFTFVPDALDMNLVMKQNSTNISSVSEGTLTSQLSFYTESDDKSLSCTVDRLNGSKALSPNDNVVELNAEFYKGNTIKGFSESEVYPLTENNSFYVDEANNTAKIRYAIPITGAISDVDLYIDGTAEEGDTAPTMKLITSSEFYKSEENDSAKSWCYTSDCTTLITKELKTTDYISKYITISALDSNVFNTSDKLNINVKGNKPESLEARIYDMAVDRKSVTLKVVANPVARKLEVNYKLPSGYTTNDVNNFTSQTSTLKYNHGTACELTVHPSTEQKGWMIVAIKVTGGGTYNSLSGKVFLNGEETRRIFEYADPTDEFVRRNGPCTYFKDGDVYIHKAYDFTQISNLVINTELLPGVDITTIDGTFDGKYNCVPEVYVKNDSTFEKITTGTFTPGKEYRLLFEHDYSEDFIKYMPYVKLNGSGLSMGSSIDDSTRWTTKYLIENNKVIIPYIYYCEKIKLKNIDVTCVGQLLAGVAPGEQTIKFKGPEDAKYSVQVEPITTWYKDEDASSNADTFELGKKYFAKVRVTADSGYQFYPWSDRNQMSITTSKGRYVDYKTPNYPDYDVVDLVIELEAEEKGITVNFEKPTTYTEMVSLTENCPTGVTVDGATIAANDIKQLELLKEYKDQKYAGYFILKTIVHFANESDRNSIKNVYYRGTKLSMTNDLIEDEEESIKSHFVNHNYALSKLGTDRIEIIEKIFVGKSYEFSIDVSEGKTVQEAKDSLQIPADVTLNKIEIYDCETVTPMQATDTFEKEKSYAVQIMIKGDSTGACSSAKVNGVNIPYKELGELVNCFEPDGYDNKLVVMNIISLKSSSGGSRKKKKTETKPVEPTELTPEEKVIEELKKEDVKKADSKEKEKINPSAKFINGYDDGTFKPERNVNNIELMSMVTELYSNVDVSNALNLNQGENYWGEEIIKKANTLGLVPGNKEDKDYNVAGEVTRGDLAIVVYNLIKDKSNSPSLTTRENCKDAIGKNYETAVTKLVDLGILKGFDDGLFHGERTLTRAEAVVVINRALRSLGFEIKLDKIELSFPDLTPEHWAYSEIMYASNK